MFTQTWAATHLIAAIATLAPVVPDLTAATCDGIELKVVTQSSDPAYSLATLVTSRAEDARLARAGDTVGAARLVYVGYNGARMSPAAWLSTPVSLCQALLLEPKARVPPRKERPAPTASRSLGASRLRVVPELENGAVVGIRLFGIRRDGLLGLLGFANGDRIDAINGYPLTSPEEVLEAYAHLRTASRLSIQLLRRGKPVTLEIHID